MTSRRVAVLVCVGVALGACGGASSYGGGSNKALTSVDSDALDTAMATFPAEVQAEFGPVSPPIFILQNNALVGFLTTGGDAIKFCTRLADFAAAKGFKDIALRIEGKPDAKGNPPAIASGTTGGTCKAA